MEKFEDICRTYFDKDMSFFEPYLNTESRLLENQYFRIPVHKGDSVVILMLWGPGSKTAIHDHGSGRGRVKVLKGLVTEDHYSFDNPELKLVSSLPHGPGEILDVAADRIHSVSNAQGESSVTLHIYETPTESLEGTLLYDPENKRIGVLNKLATRASWSEKPVAFSSIRPFGL
jgi:hypothetical protein